MELYNKVKGAGTVPIYESTKLIFVSNEKQHWIFPKGKLKKHENADNAALRESMEEAGISGDLDLNYQISKKGYIFYIMKVVSIEEVYPECEIRTRLILTFEEALNHDKVSSYVKEIIREVIEYRNKLYS